MLRFSIVLSIAMLLGGVVVGYWINAPTQYQPRAGQAADSHADDHALEDHVDISGMAARSLGLRLESIVRQPFRKHLHVPGLVIEKPGQSGLDVTSPIQGIVRKIHRFPGQALSPGDLLFTMQVADQPLETAQLALLDILTRITVTERELLRLVPLAQTGAIDGRKKLEVEYQLKQLLAERAARLQELLLRGLSAEQIDRIVNERDLISEIEIRLVVEEAHTNVLDDASDSSALHYTGSGLIYTVERVDVVPGRSVTKGEELCHIANHYELFLRGEAFETDVPAIMAVSERGWGITAEFGHDSNRFQVSDLTVTYMDNHVDRETQTFPFYLPLVNRVVSEHQDAQGRVFRSWEFKPGQRAHVLVPTHEWVDRIVLPRDAVVRSGPESLVFRLALTKADSAEAGPIDPLEFLELDELEMQPVSVQVLDRDGEQVVVADDGELGPGDVVAMNHAYQLFLAWKLQVSGGGGHEHDH